jgi:hypothetical protein
MRKCNKQCVADRGGQVDALHQFLQSEEISLARDAGFVRPAPACARPCRTLSCRQDGRPAAARFAVAAGSDPIEVPCVLQGLSLRPRLSRHCASNSRGRRGRFTCAVERAMADDGRLQEEGHGPRP